MRALLQAVTLTRAVLPAAAAFALVVVAGCALQPRTSGDPASGHRLAEHWCSECHRVSPSDPSGTRAGHTLPPPVDAPDFAAIVRRPYADRAYLERFAGELHLPMPIYRLSEDERRDIVAYLLSLR